MPRKLSEILPPGILRPGSPVAGVLLKTVMIRSNFVPQVRHGLGWRGVQEIVTPDLDDLALTCRIQDLPGIFGLQGLFCKPEQASFDLYYFPSQEDALIEDFSVQAGLAAFQPDFSERVRFFNKHADLCSLFWIGTLQVVLDLKKQIQALSLEAQKRMLVLAKDGLELKTDDGPVQAVKPGEADQNLSAFELGKKLFSVLASSFCYILGSLPSLLAEGERPGYKRVYSENGHWQEFLSPECANNSIILSIGSSEELPGSLIRRKNLNFVWKTGEAIPKRFAKEAWWKAGSSSSGEIKKRVFQPEKPKLILLTGFLGSGKTSFLDKFIERQVNENLFVAVIQNEIGEKGLDGKLLEENYAVKEIDEGCVCCTLAGSLKSAALEIMQKHDPDFVVLETTGLANPGNILQEIYELDDIMEFCSITCLVDGIGGLEALEKYEVARNQVRLADVVLLNKRDLAFEEDLRGLEKKIARLNPLVPVHRTRHGDIHPALLYGVNMQISGSRVQEDKNTINCHENHLKDQIKNILLRPKGPLNTESLVQEINKRQEDILRAKGVLELQEEPFPVVFQYSPGTYSIEPAPREIEEERYLVVIGQNLEKVKLEGLA